MMREKFDGYVSGYIRQTISFGVNVDSAVTYIIDKSIQDCERAMLKAGLLYENLDIPFLIPSHALRRTKADLAHLKSTIYHGVHFEHDL